MSLASVFTVKTTSVDIAVAFIFYIHTFSSHPHTLICTSIKFSSICLWLCIHWKLWYVIPALVMLHVFFMKAQRALGALSFVKRLSESKIEKTPYLSSAFGGLMTASAAQFLGNDGVWLCRDQYQTLNATAKSFDTAYRLDKVQCVCLY